jgi:hypothetical protein
MRRRRRRAVKVKPIYLVPAWRIALFSLIIINRYINRNRNRSIIMRSQITPKVSYIRYQMQFSNKRRNYYALLVQCSALAADDRGRGHSLSSAGGEING